MTPIRSCKRWLAQSWVVFVLFLNACVPASGPREQNTPATSQESNAVPLGQVTNQDERNSEPHSQVVVIPPRIAPTAASANHSEGALAVSDLTGLSFVSIEPGSFRRGSTKEQVQSIVDNWSNADGALLADELPDREIHLSRPFEISATEVPQKVFESVMGSNPSVRKGDDFPVHNVLFEEAVEFCARLSMKTGKKYRLPTEAEWEFSCRAGSGRLWSFGDDVDGLDQFAWYDDNSDGIAIVGAKRANAWGLFDMHGNVWEWCSDFFATDAYATSSDTDPTGPPNGPGHVVRGGSAFDEAFLTRSAERDFGPSFRKMNIGFRIVREP
ncbi:MAG: SUMF1/EgtB/PvdO family nonheme iron enzyme [Planctomycetota bacterium]